MKRSLCFLSFNLFALWLPAQVAFGCSVDFPSLREEFRGARHVFVAQVVDIQDPPRALVGAKEKGIFGVVKFEIEKSWKGTKAKEIALFSNVGGSVCPGDFDYFKKGEKYLVFADRDYVDYTSTKRLEWAKDKMRRLDGFWFRTWARIYPF